VLFVTAHDDPKAKGDAMAGRCEGYFRKTATGVELLDTIRRLIAPLA
jgi:hypothetical protein